MRSSFNLIIFIIYWYYCWTDPILPSYERDEGDWPIGVDKTMDNVIDRWFIDINDAKCKPLEYRGIKGNYNNFASKGLCEMHGKLTIREKLRGCKKPMHPGHCVKNSSTDEKHYFDQTTASCKTFNYNGCGGSFNRYESDEECYLYCFNKKNGGLTNADDTIINKQKDKEKYLSPNYLDCTLKPDVKDKDPGTAIIADVDNKKCAFAAVSIDTDTRGIFSSFSECVKKSYKNSEETKDGVIEKKKKVPACEGGPSQHASKNGGTDIKRYYYDEKDDVCKQMETGPLPTDESDFNKEKNSFPTMEMCHSYCGAGGYKKEIKIEETCKMSKAGNSGTGDFIVTRYYYNHASKKCQAFNYKGYGGNSNNFKSGTECKTICEGHYNEDTTVTIETTVEIEEEGT